MQPHFPYPSLAEREDFYRAYLSIEMDALNGEEVLGRRKDVKVEKVEALEREVRIWSPACNIFWALWGIVQADEHVNAMVDKRDHVQEFDYLVSGP